MKTASIEFITFDAQDVIATSGVLTAYFTLSSALKSGWGYMSGLGIASFTNFPYAWAIGCYDGMDDGNSYQLTSDGTTWGGSGDPRIGDTAVSLELYGITQVGSIPVGAEELGTFEAIYDWVATNCKPAK